MAIEKLQIKELSPSGELLGVLTCHGGQITVMRAINNSDLAKYLRALAGVPGKDRFSISIDDEEFHPNQHNLIGFGERFASEGDEGTVEEYLSRCGVPQQALGATLAAVGLDEKSQTVCSALNADEERRLRIVAATFEPHKALVLNDPFDPISSSWRERFAELLSSFAKTRNGLVLVPFLSFRPESWIDNERVARLQVGQNVQKTIGFGAAPSQVHSVIQQIRQEAQQSESDSAAPKDLDAEQITEVSHDSLSDAGSSDNKLRRSVAPLGLALLVLVGVMIGLWGFPSTQNDSQLASSSLSSTAPAQQPEVTASSQSSVMVSSPASQAAVEPTLEPASSAPTTSPEPEVRVARLLDLYPASIRASIVESFEGAVSAAPRSSSIDSPRLSRDQLKARAPSKPAQGNTSDLLSVLETTSTNKPAEPAPAAQPSDSELEGMTPEQRREVIRQRFLEAIQRASQQPQ